MPEKKLTKAQADAAKYTAELPKLTVNPKTARRGVGRFDAQGPRPKQPQVYTNALYKLTATHERLQALKMTKTAKVVHGEIVLVAEQLLIATAFWKADAADAAVFVKDLDVQRIGDLGIKPEAMREFLDGQKD